MISIDWSLTNKAAAKFARTYDYHTVEGIDPKKRALLRKAVSENILQGEPLRNLVQALVPAFGREAAKVVAVTELTRAYALANLESWRKSGVVWETKWETANDDDVDDICRGNERAEAVPLGQPFPSGHIAPPAHDGCRCSLRPNVHLNE